MSASAAVVITDEGAGKGSRPETLSGFGLDADRWTFRSIAMIAACGVGNMLSVASVVNATFSNFLIPASESLGWSRAEFSFLLTILGVVSVFAFPLAGWMIDRFGPRRIALYGNLVYGTMVMALAAMPAQRVFTYLLFACLAIVSTLPSTVLYARVLATWFFRRRGLAQGIAAGAAFGIGGAVLPIVAQILIDNFGWRMAYLGLGMMVVCVGFPVSLAFLHEAPGFRVTREAAPVLSGMSRGEALREPTFWILFASIACGSGSVQAIITHVVPLAEQAGQTPAVALAALAALFLVNAIWQVVVGMVLDVSGRPALAALFVLPGIGGALLFASGSPGAGGLLLAGILLGISTGTEYGLLSFCIPRYFGFRAYGQIYGWIFGGIILVQGITPFLMDLLYESKGDYRTALWCIGWILAGSGVLLSRLPRNLM
jgi:MFS family permease